MINPEDKLLETAGERLKRLDYHAAKEIYEEVLKTSHENIDACLGYIIATVLLGHKELAQQFYKKKLHVFVSQDWRVIIAKTRACAWLGDYKQELMLWNDANAKNFGNDDENKREFLEIHIYVIWATGEAENIIKSCDALIDLDPENAIAWVPKITFAYLKNDSEGESLLTECKNFSTFPKIALWVCYRLSEKKRFNELIKHYEKSLRLIGLKANERLSLYHDLIIAYEKTPQYATALKNAKEATKIYPNSQASPNDVVKIVEFKDLQAKLKKALESFTITWFSSESEKVESFCKMVVATLETNKYQQLLSNLAINISQVEAKEIDALVQSLKETYQCCIKRDLSSTKEQNLVKVEEAIATKLEKFIQSFQPKEEIELSEHEKSNKPLTIIDDYYYFNSLEPNL